MRRTMRLARFARHGLCRSVLAAALSMSVPTLTYAKPPDLPTDQGINFADENAPIPPVTPADTLDPARRVASPADERIDPAKAVFEAAETARAQGRNADARKGYERVHLLSPTSREGVLAIERLQSLLVQVRGNGFSEEQEPPVSRTSNRPSIRDFSEAQEPTETPRPRGRAPKRTREEMRRALELLRQTEPLDMVPFGPGSF
jgi:hypothetical protein